MTRGAVVALSHGGGPMPILGDPGHREITRSLRERVPQVLKLIKPLERPRAIIVLTAHWSERNPTISNGPRHELYYDYGGFPAEAYELSYPAPGSPEVAQELFEAFKSEGLNPQLDSRRGWDHGVFVPMLLIRPAADIPIVQVSVLESEDPEEHFKMGRALQKLRDSNVAIIGSGFASMHNLRFMLGSGRIQDPKFRATNKAWTETLEAAVDEEDEKEREGKLKGWRDFPGGYEMHPPGAGEHFMPLLVCAAAGGNSKPKQYTDEFLTLDMYTWYWE